MLNTNWLHSIAYFHKQNIKSFGSNVIRMMDLFYSSDQQSLPSVGRLMADRQMEWVCVMVQEHRPAVRCSPLNIGRLSTLPTLTKEHSWTSMYLPYWFHFFLCLALVLLVNKKALPNPITSTPHPNHYPINAHWKLILNSWKPPTSHSF